MFARVVRIQGQPDSPDRLEEVIRSFQERAETEWRRLDGFKRATLLVDRASGQVVAMSLWESEDALRASEAVVGQHRAQAAQRLGGSAPTIEVYEVAVDT